MGNKISETGEIDQRTEEAIASIGKNPFSLNLVSLSGGQGLWSHSNVRMDLFDITPQPGVIDLIKSL